jgi:PLD-like domain
MNTKKTFLYTAQDGLTMFAYPGDGSVLIAFNLDQKPKADFAGFAIKCTPPNGAPYYLLNRLNFKDPITAGTIPSERKYTPSNEAPFQKFRWVHVPATIKPGEYEYEGTTMYFKPGGGLKPGASTSLTFEMTAEKFENFDFGFTRGYLSSQAYADKFNNKPIRPNGNETIDFDTTTFSNRYDWLGFHARDLIFSFLKEAIDDLTITVDAFVYDIDEPDIIRDLEKLGGRLRIFMDNATLHTKAGALEPQVQIKLIESAGANQVKAGHFKRFAHNKVFIQKKNGQPIKVLTGSANFSLRGLYVQANNVLVFNDPDVARLYENAFNQAFTDPSKTQKSFAKSLIASGYFDINFAGSPISKVAFSPHLDDKVSLGRVAEEIEQADNCVLFAIMELGGTGPVLEKIKNLDTKEIFTYGITQNSKNLNVFKAGSNRAKVVPFAYLKDKVPAPFKEEFGGGMGQVVHHKFVVVDFNDSDPVVFTGSSNLAAGGEKANGDNLIAIYDRGIATAYCVEAVRLLDHYDFRQTMKKATNVKPLKLKGPADSPRWWTPYFDENQMKYRDRLVFSHPAED